MIVRHETSVVKIDSSTVGHDAVGVAIDPMVVGSEAGSVDIDTRMVGYNRSSVHPTKLWFSRISSKTGEIRGFN